MHSSASGQGGRPRPRAPRHSLMAAASGRRKSSGAFMRWATPARASAAAVSASAANPAPRSAGTDSTDSRYSVAWWGVLMGC